MKFNFGTGAVVALLLFMGFILSFVWKATFNPKYDHTLVSENYYEEDINYQQEKNNRARATTMQEQVEINVEANGLTIVFPNEMTNDKVQGELKLLRYANKRLDVVRPIKLTANTMRLDKSQDKLALGKYNLILAWTYQGEKYLIKKEIFIK